MQAFEINENNAGQRLDKYLVKLMPAAPKSFIYKMLRKKNIVLNDKKAEGSEKTKCGDVVKLYLADDTIKTMRGMDGHQNVQTQTNIAVKAKTVTKAKSEPVPDEAKNISLDVLYQDKHVLLINKPQGILSQKSVPSDVSMVELVNAYLLENGYLKEEDLETFHPAVVNRLDRNTSGIICAGISLAGLQDLSELFRNRTMKKEYLCVVKGVMKSKQHLKGYLVKDHRTNKVKVYKEKPEGELDKNAERIETSFTPLASNEHYTLLCVDLITGKSHQIRAHLASIGHPIVGDEKYGDASVNKRAKAAYGIHFQCLHAWRMTFPKLDGALAGLSEKQITAEPPENMGRLLKGEKLLWQPGQAGD